ncbi:MAG: very short patch repair endonuclease [Dehalococcoidia bacterium]
MIGCSPSPQRSRNMAAIRSTNTKPELFVRRKVHAAGYRFRLHQRELPGKPDLVFGRRRVAVFVHGCFWHGHVCKEARPPKSNTSYWLPKIARNVQRDRRSATHLRKLGWTVVTIRECDLERGTGRLLRLLGRSDWTLSRASDVA